MQELNEVVGHQHHNFFGSRLDDDSDLRFMEPFVDQRFGIMDAFATLMRQRMAGRNPNFDIRARSSVVPENGIAFGSGPSGSWSMFHGQGPGRMSDNDGLDFFFSGSPRIGRRLENFNDFFTGPGLEELIEQVTLNNRRGPPPAPRSAIEAMPTVKITQRHLSTDSHCPVCKDEFELGSEARQMPCNHIYHSECIMPWLIQHNSCPVCRLELPLLSSSMGRSNRRSTGGNEGAGGGGNSSGTENSGLTQGRRNPLSFLWPFRSSNQTSSRYDENGGSGSTPTYEEHNEMNHSAWPFDY